MEPEPSPETVIEAHPVDEPTYEVNIKKNNEINITEIQLFIREKTNKIIYEKIISINSDFWNEIKSKFQNNFDIFYVVLESALIKKTNENLSSEIILENFGKPKLRLELHYTSELFGFKINIFLTKQKEKIDILKEENDILKKKIESLEMKVESLESLLDYKFGFIEEKIYSLCKIVDMMGPQYMRSIIGADTIYTSRGYINTKYIDVIGTTGLNSFIPSFNGVSAEPIKFLTNVLNGEQKSGAFEINDNEIIKKYGGDSPDALVWSKTAWELIKKDKQWNID